MLDLNLFGISFFRGFFAGGDGFGGEAGESGQAGGDPLVEKGIGPVPGTPATAAVVGDQAPTFAVFAGGGLRMSFEAFIEEYKLFLGYALQPLILAVGIGIFVPLIRKG